MPRPPGGGVLEATGNRATAVPASRWTFPSQIILGRNLGTRAGRRARERSARRQEARPGGHVPCTGQGQRASGRGRPPMSATGEVREAAVVLVGAGIMSTTLGVMLKELQPDLTIELFEVLEREAQESSSAWNNAGTGHAALCELNYTPPRSDGSIDISKALDVNVEFDLSRQFWSYLVKTGAIRSPESFIHPVPHMSFVRGADHVAFLEKRHAALSAHHCYRGMEYTEDKRELAEWIPLVMEGRDPKEIVAATRMVTGTDVDYGALTKNLLTSLKRREGF